MWIAKGTLALWLLGLAGCASNQDVGSLATVHAVLQKDAPGTNRQHHTFR